MQWFKPNVILQFLRYVFHIFLRHQGFDRARALTFTSLFAVVPLLTLTIAILSAFPTFQVFGSEIQSMIFDRLLPAYSSELENYMASFIQQARALTWVGALMLLATAYFMLVEIEKSFNVIWGVGDLRKGLSSFLLYWSVLSLGPLLLGLAFAISSYITSLSLFETFTEMSETVGANNLLLQIFPLVSGALGFTFLYMAVPNCGVQFRHAVVGGVAVTFSFVIVKQIFTWFISVTSYQIVYGTFAAIPIFLMWIYICWVLILLGANLVRAIPLFSMERTSYSVHPTLLMLALLHNFWSKHQEGSGLNVRELVEDRWPFSGNQIEQFIDLLIERRVIRACSQDEYILARDLKNVTIWEVLKWLPWPPPREEELARPLPDAVRRHLPDFETLKDRFETVEESSKEQFSQSVDNFFRKSNTPLDSSDRIIRPAEQYAG